jgi:colanic acid biosynthesis glycosyl transferase WcaI
MGQSIVLRFGILTQYYPPEMGAPQARLSDLARRLREQGHEVTVLTAMPNYPSGRVQRGYRALFRREVRDGVCVLRAGILPTKSVRLVPRLASYFSFVASSFVIGGLALPRLDFLLTESPPLFLGIAGFLLARWKQARWIFNVSDLWPESALRLRVVGEGFGLSMARRLEAFCYRRAWLVSGQSREILDDIQRRFPAVRTYHLSNGVDTIVFRPERASREARGRLVGDAADSECVAIYAGLHGMAQGLDQVLGALARLDGVRPLMVFVGDGPEREGLVRRGAELGLRCVRFRKPIPYEDIPELLASADIAVVPLKIRLPGAVPSKIYEAMASGVPVLLVADGEAANIVSEAGAGVVVEPGNVAGLADALAGLAGDPEGRRRMGRAGRVAALRDFDRRNIADGFIRYLESLGTC